MNKMKIRNRVFSGPALFATRCVDTIEEVFYAKAVKMGNLIYLYNSGGYVVRVVSPNEIVG